MKIKNIHIRVSESDHIEIMKAARRQGLTVSAYLLALLKKGAAKSE